MTFEIKVPTLPESIADALIVTWHKKEGDPVKRDEVLVDIETDKVVMEVPAAEDGILGKIIEPEGTTVSAHQLIGSIEEGGADSGVAASAEAAPAAATDSADDSSPGQTSPSVRKLLDTHGLSASDVNGSGKNGRISKEDVEKHVAGGGSIAPAKANATANVAPAPLAATALPIVADGERTEKRVPMSRMRARIAERLLSATQTTAMLTTFNEVDMSQFIALRSQYKDRFEKSHEVKLGFMSIFIKAATEALKRYPDVNASIDGDDVVYHGFCDIGVAISTDRGLVVPILRNAEYMSLAEIEADIAEFAEKGRDGKLSMDDIIGGTFSITNGGVFGSMLSTPILNPPQSAILGMHKIQDRAVVEDAAVVVRPIMYLALTYDHRIVDGKSAVTFLKTIVDLLEDPASMLLDL